VDIVENLAIERVKKVFGADVGVVAHHQNSVLQRFALGSAGCLGIREADDTCAKAIGSCLETELGTSRWFEEKGHRHQAGAILYQAGNPGTLSQLLRLPAQCRGYQDGSEYLF
jgi:hypothetical protein